MKVGDWFPVAYKDKYNEIIISPFKVTKIHSYKQIKSRKDDVCVACGEKIIAKTVCYASAITLKAEDGCPIIFVRVKWHNECDNATYEQLEKSLRRFVKERYNE